VNHMHITWTCAFSHAIICPLCQIFFVVSNAISTPPPANPGFQPYLICEYPIIPACILAPAKKHRCDNSSVTFGLHLVSLYGLQHSAYVHFSVLALSSIFFLWTPRRAAHLSAITEGSDAARRRRIAAQGRADHADCAGGIRVRGRGHLPRPGHHPARIRDRRRSLLLLIGLDMLQARRSATQEVAGDTAAAAQKEDAGVVPLGVPMLAGPERLHR